MEWLHTQKQNWLEMLYWQLIVAHTAASIMTRQQLWQLKLWLGIGYLRFDASTSRIEYNDVVSYRLTTIISVRAIHILVTRILYEQRRMTNSSQNMAVVPGHIRFNHYIPFHDTPQQYHH